MNDVIGISYLVASISFIVGLKYLGAPATARRGNLIAAAGMGLAVLVTIVGPMFGASTVVLPPLNLTLLVVALVVGTVIGWIAAQRVQMTAMPQMVSLFNGMGGLCAALIGILEYDHALSMACVVCESCTEMSLPIQHMIPTLAGLVIGTVSFSGSIVAWAKLDDRLGDRRFANQHIVNLALLTIIIVVAVLMTMSVVVGSAPLVILLVLCLLYGISFVLPIGGADMPVVISLLNSFTGVAAACGGFVYDNQPMLIGGILVGSAGTLLTIVMCRAMNRSLLNVLVGAMGGTSAQGVTTASGGSVKSVTATDVAILLAYSRKVVIVPGYGLAVAQAQHVCHQLEHDLVARGIDVAYAIHPVAGRMPGHMNVLLAEADVSYDRLKEMEDINPEFSTTDVVLVVGANDVVNPAARTDTSSPIYGMPILDVDHAKQVIVLKRSMKAGYAGIDNELFTRPNCSMLFGDAKSTLTSLVAELKNL